MKAKIYYGLSESVYHTGQPWSTCLSSSLLRRGLQSGWHHATSTKADVTKAMELGTAIHCMALTPERVHDEVAVFDDEKLCQAVKLEDGSTPKKPRQTKQYQALKAEFEQQAQGRIVVNDREYAQCKLAANEACLLMFDSWSYSKDHKVATEGCDTEISVMWQEDVDGINIPCKARIDLYDWANNIMWDLKTTADTTGWGVKVWGGRDLPGYYLQMAWYARAVHAAAEIWPNIGRWAVVQSDGAKHVSTNRFYLTGEQLGRCNCRSTRSSSAMQSSCPGHHRASDSRRCHLGPVDTPYWFRDRYLRQENPRGSY